jgi:tetratricopeptide (TPR) repeat protein
MEDETLELLISIGHFARVKGRFDDARYLFDRLALLYPERAFAYLGLGLVEIDRAQYRKAAQWFETALDVVPDYGIALAWLGVSLVFERRYALAVRSLIAASRGDDESARGLASTFLAIPECAPYARAYTTAALSVPTHSLHSTHSRLNARG